MIILGENIPSDVSILNRSNLIFMSESKRKSKPEYSTNFEYLKENTLLLKKLGYTVKRYILEHYTQDKVDRTRKMIAESLKRYELGSREFKTMRDCVFGLQALNDAVKHYTWEVIFDDLNQVAQVIYENIVENVTGGSESATADYIKVLEKIDMMVQDGTLKEGWHYVFDQENDVIKIDIKRSYLEMLSYCKDKNIKMDIMSESEFIKKIKNSDFIAGNTSNEYYKPQRLYVAYNKKALKRVYLLKMSVCKKYEFMGLSNQVDIDPTK